MTQPRWSRRVRGDPGLQQGGSHAAVCRRSTGADASRRARAVVVDGGSTDDTVALVGEASDLTLIADVGEQWWTGATWLGIDHALRHGEDDDYVMLLNNDTALPPDMIEVLVAESQRLGAVVAPVALDASDGSVVIAGATIDWDKYRVHHRTAVPSGQPSTWPTDVHEGRARSSLSVWCASPATWIRDRLPSLRGRLRVQPSPCPPRVPPGDHQPNLGRRAPRRHGALPVPGTDDDEAALVGGDQQALVPELRHPVHIDRPGRAGTGQVEAEAPICRSFGDPAGAGQPVEGPPLTCASRRDCPPCGSRFVLHTARVRVEASSSMCAVSPSA